VAFFSYSYFLFRILSPDSSETRKREFSFVTPQFCLLFKCWSSSGVF